MYSNKRIYKFTRLLAWLFTFASTLILAYIFYRSEIVFDGRNIESFKYAYIFASINLFFWLFSLLKLTDEARSNVMLITTSTIFIIFLLEFALSILEINNKFPNRAGIAKKLGIEFDDRSKIEIINDLKHEGVDAYPHFDSIINMVDQGGLYSDELGYIFPLTGVSKKTTVLCNEGGKYSIYESDRYGFNNQDSDWNQENIDWLIVGDSFAHGACVERENNIAGQLMKLNGEKIINLGNSGNGPLIELASLKEYTKVINPKNVLWVFYEGNDLRKDLPREKSIPILMNYLDPSFSQDLVEKQKIIDKLIKDYISDQEKNIPTEVDKKSTRAFNFKSFILLSEIRKILGINGLYIKPLYLEKNNIDPVFYDILKEARDYTISIGAQLYFVYIPMQTLETNKQVIDIAKDLDIPVIDIYEKVIETNSDRLNLYPLQMLDNHYNEKGYAHVARAIVSSVKQYEKVN
jgi:hypothetical protein